MWGPNLNSDQNQQLIKSNQNYSFPGMSALIMLWLSHKRQEELIAATNLGKKRVGSLLIKDNIIAITR